MKVTDADTWSQIEKGEITGFSMWGVGKREKISKASSGTDDESVEKGLLHTIAKALTRIVKGQVKEKYNRDKQSNDFWTAWHSFSSTVQRYNWQTDRYEFESDPDKAREAIQDFTDILQEILGANDIAKALGKPPAEIAKAGKKLSAARLDKLKQAHSTITDLLAEVDDQTGNEEDDDVKAEDIQKAVMAAMSPITKQLNDLQAEVAELKKDEGGEPPAAPVPPAADTVTEAIQKALEPIAEQVQTLAADVQLVKNSRGPSGQPPSDAPIIKNDVPSYIRLMNGGQ